MISCGTAAFSAPVAEKAKNKMFKYKLLIPMYRLKGYIQKIHILLCISKNICWGRMMQNKEIFNVFFREKPAMMLVRLRSVKSEMYASSLAKQIDCTYSHVVKILQQMQKAGLVNFNKQGRLKLLSLTKKGQDVAEMIDNIRNTI